MGILQNLFRSKPTGLRQFLEEGALIVDVRSPLEFSGGHIKGSKNIPLDQLAGRVDEIKRYDKPVVTVCQSGMRSSKAKALLVAAGIKAVNGGSWSALNQIV